MDENKVLAFIKRLSNDTANEKITWQRLNDYQHMVSNAPNALTNMLFECEYRHIDYHNSYFATVLPGDIFMLYEDNESGRDAGIRSVGYKLYLCEDSGNNVSSLPCPAHAIYQLLNAVQSCIAKSESDAEKFIDTYLSQN